MACNPIIASRYSRTPPIPCCYRARYEAQIGLQRANVDESHKHSRFSGPTMGNEACMNCRYDEINLNCGCPSDRVAGAGCFGASLMLQPELVAACCAAMQQAASVPVTVKCRIGLHTLYHPEYAGGRTACLLISKSPVKCNDGFRAFRSGLLGYTQQGVARQAVPGRGDNLSHRNLVQAWTTSTRTMRFATSSTR